MSFGQLLNKLNQRSTPLIPRNKFFRFILVIITAFSLVYLSQSSFAISSFIDKKNAIKEGNNQESWLDEAMGSNMISLFVGMVGDVPDEIFDVNADASIINQYKYNPGGAFGTMNRFIATLHTPPASGIEYIAQVRDNFLGKPAYAQGVGFQGLQFLLPLWRGFRNVIYVISTLIFIIIGMMIMLRVKISPQAVITLQSAIPKLITTLILVTFSYAIAGLVIDIANFLQALVIAIFFSINGKNFTQNLFTQVKFDSGIPFVTAIMNVITGLINGWSSFDFKHLSNPNLVDLQTLTYRAVPGWISMMMLGGLLGSIVIGFLLGGVGAWFGGAGNFVTDMAGRLVGGAIGGALGIIIPLILTILCAIWLIKLYFGLLKCYVTLIFKIILGPLEIGMGAFPNSKMGFSTWIMDVASNMAVFPVVGIFLVLLNMVIDAVSMNGIFSKAVWAPSLISAGGITPAILGAAIGLSGLAMLSKLPSLVPEFIFKIKPSPFGAAIGENLGGVAALGSKSAKMVSNAALTEVGKGSGGYGIFGEIGGKIDRRTQTGTAKTITNAAMGKGGN